MKGLNFIPIVAFIFIILAVMIKIWEKVDEWRFDRFIQVGQCYIEKVREDTNPFKENKREIVCILEKKDGYVKYNSFNSKYGPFEYNGKTVWMDKYEELDKSLWPKIPEDKPVEKVVKKSEDVLTKEEIDMYGEPKLPDSDDICFNGKFKPKVGTKYKVINPDPFEKWKTKSMEIVEIKKGFVNKKFTEEDGRKWSKADEIYWLCRGVQNGMFVEMK